MISSMSLANTTLPSSTSSKAAGSNSSSTGATGASTVTKNMFLQLLVAQMKNQDPLNPTDSVQYLTQLAQFQTLEQSINMGTDLTAIRTDLDSLVGATGSGTGTSTNTTTGTTKTTA